MPDIPTNNTELYLANIAGESERMPDFPTNKIERYLAKIAGVTSDVIDIPTNNVELYLAYIAGESVVLPKCPTNVIERYLAYIAGGAEVMPPFPTNIVERYLAKIAINGLGTEKTKTGAIVHITDALAKAVKALTVAIEPVQAGSGDPSPDNVRPISGWTGANVTKTGKNILTYKYTEAVTNNGVTLTPNSDGSVTLTGTATGNAYFPLDLHFDTTKFAGYKITGFPATGPFPLNTSSINVRITNQSNYTALKDFITDSTGVVYNNSLPDVGSDCRCFLRVVTRYVIPSGGMTFKIMFLPAIESDITYEPPSADTYSITFPASAGTVYGGTLDVTNGKLTVTHAQIGSYAGESLPGEWISDRDVYTPGASPTTGAQVVYELATPVEYDLTPTEVTLLLGENNIWSDAGSTTVTYLADGNASDEEALGILLGGTYNRGVDDPTDAEALSILLGGTT